MEFAAASRTGIREGLPGGRMAPMATVLVVEDERDIRELLRRYLERAGHSVLTAGTGAEGDVPGGGGFSALSVALSTT